VTLEAASPTGAGATAADRQPGLDGALSRAARRVEELASEYRPPSFDEVPGPDAALFLCAIDHGTGYRGSYLVGGKGPFEGSALLWQLGLLAERRHPGLLTARCLAEVDGARVAEIFRVGGETAREPEVRARLWRDLAEGMIRDYDGSADALLAACDHRLGGSEGLIPRLATFEAFADPLQKKAYLFAKICARRDWLDVADPDRWEVCADNVLMRLALRSGLVHPGSRDEVRAATRAAFKRVAAEAGISPPVLDDLLWERGLGDPDLLGTEGGDLREPDRDPDSVWY
jgi:hypothetical protein